MRNLIFLTDGFLANFRLAQDGGRSLEHLYHPHLWKPLIVGAIPEHREILDEEV